jgi:hypothetical protein
MMKVIPAVFTTHGLSGGKIIAAKVSQKTAIAIKTIDRHIFASFWQKMNLTAKILRLTLCRDIPCT